MRSVSLEQVAQATSGQLEGEARPKLRSIGIDSREEPVKDLFVALRGERHDGHRFLDEAVRGGAKAVLVQRRNQALPTFRAGHPGFPMVLVKDSLRALGDLAAWVRRDLTGTAVGITGSTGKTCTKDLLVAALGTSMKVAASPGSYNNEVGVPLTIFRASGREQALVVEMGARHGGDVARLADIVSPRYGIITNVGPSHLSLFKTLENVYKAKAELATALPEDGALILNRDDEWSARIARRCRAEVIWFGNGRGAAYRAVQTALDAQGRPSFVLKGPAFEVGVALPLPGRHQVGNAVAAAACAHRMGVAPEDIARGLARARLSGWRVQVSRSPSGCTVLNDCYNANPVSMQSALETLSEMGEGRRTVAVLGGMAELGGESRSYHTAVGRAVTALDVDILVTVGRRGRDYAASALASGLPRGSVYRCADGDEALELLEVLAEPGDVILVKASRVVGLEHVAQALAGSGGAATSGEAANA